MVGYRSPGMSVPEMLTELIAGGMSNGQAAHELARAIEDGALTLIDKTDVHAWCRRSFDRRRLSGFARMLTSSSGTEARIGIPVGC